MSINYEQMFKDAVIRACNADGILSLENSEPIATIGICYMNGYGTEKNDKNAFNFLSMAVDLGNVEAICYLAQCYIDGIGTEKDEEKGFYYLKKQQS